MEPKRILCAASFAYGEGSTSWHRVQAIKKLGHLVTFVDTTPPSALKMGGLLPIRLVRKLTGIEIDWGKVNQQLLSLINKQEFDAFWIDKGTHLSESVFQAFRRKLPEATIIGYSPDDMMVPANKSKRFVASLPFYDVFFTTKSFHLTELTELGCRNVQFIDNAYHEDLHHPVKVSKEDRRRFGHEVIFIGSFEDERADFIRYLAENGISVRVWGDSLWKTFKNPPPLMKLEYRPIFADDYTTAVCASDICLCFLRKLNRDLQTTRSVEIPACGTLMVAERTHEHLSLFADNEEAVFFDTKEELLKKVEFYLRHPKDREIVAKAGRRRCVEGGYSNLERMRTMLDKAFASKRMKHINQSFPRADESCYKKSL